MLKKILCGIIIISTAFTLCGCNIFNADTAELLAPPALSGDMHPISEAINKSVSESYTFAYPSRGDHRSAVVQYDLNGDGIHEAFAFYSTQSQETTTMHINLVKNIKGKWESVATQSIPAGGVDRVDFRDLNNDGVDEILVGWEIYGTTELQLAVYEFKDETLNLCLAEGYTHYLTCELDNDDRNEIMIIRSLPAEGKNSAHLFKFTTDTVSEISFCELDGTIKTFNHPVTSTLSNGKNAVYLDGIKGIGAVTEVLFMDNGQLVNPLLTKGATESDLTLRSANLEVFDINEDGILEIPVQSEVPTVTTSADSEKLYLTNWCSFDGESLISRLTALINMTDGYYYCLPYDLIGKIAVLKDTKNSTMEIYSYSPKKAVTKERLIIFKTVSKEDWDSDKFDRQDFTEITHNDEFSYLCYVSPTAEEMGITIDSMTTDFKLY